jgi:hypothetical protein
VCVVPKLRLAFRSNSVCGATNSSASEAPGNGAVSYNVTLAVARQSYGAPVTGTSDRQRL